MSVKDRTSLVTRLLNLAKEFNCFYLHGLAKGHCVPFIVEGYQVGLIRPDIFNVLKQYSNVFKYKDGYMTLNSSLRNYNERSEKVEMALKDCKNKNLLVALKGWRNEDYEVRPNFSSEPLFKMDRSATCLLGVCNYGVCITGYVEDPVKGICVWLQKRSSTKETWPGKWDTMVGGGLSVGFSVLDTAHKEAEEEAMIPKCLLDSITPAGTVSFFFESERGLFPNTEFVFDLKLPLDFVPRNMDGEVEKFELVSVEDAVDRLFSKDFKTTSCPILIDFLIRHGIITSNNESDFPELIELLHTPLQGIYKNFHNYERNGNLFCKSHLQNAH